MPAEERSVREFDRESKMTRRWSVRLKFLDQISAFAQEFARVSPELPLFDRIVAVLERIVVALGSP